MSELHCWTDKREHLLSLLEFGTAAYWDRYAEQEQQPSATCLLMDGHKEPHRFTSDSEFTIEFAEMDRSEA